MRTSLINFDSICNSIILHEVLIIINKSSIMVNMNHEKRAKQNDKNAKRNGTKFQIIDIKNMSIIKSAHKEDNKNRDKYGSHTDNAYEHAFEGRISSKSHNT